MTDFAAIAGRISAALNVKCAPSPARGVSGGSINACYRWETDSESLFVKVADRTRQGMLEAEAAGLEELARPNAVRVPQVRLCGTTSSHAFLALEWIEPGRSGDADWRFGEQLAQLHHFISPRFGWSRDNTIGLTLQKNDWADEWPRFYRDRRLAFQIELAVQNGHGRELESEGRRLLERVPLFFSSYSPEASLLHGDLWGGNWLTDEHGQPVIVDPACYYGDREADLAMTHLFGGFDYDFYLAYQAAWPLDSGYQDRQDLYNLYHVLNHANLFGGGYVQQAHGMIHRLLAQTGG